MHTRSRRRDTSRWRNVLLRSSGHQPRHRVVLTHPLGLSGERLAHHLLTQCQHTTHLLEDLKHQLLVIDKALLARAEVKCAGDFSVRLLEHQGHDEVKAAVSVLILTHSDLHAMDLLERLQMSSLHTARRAPTHVRIVPIADERDTATDQAGA